MELMSSIVAVVELYVNLLSSVRIKSVVLRRAYTGEMKLTGMVSLEHYK